MKLLSGHTQPFAVLGHPIGHTLSPVMHNAALTSMGMDAIYLAFDVEPGRLMTVLQSMASMGFRGVNLTVPLKEVAYKGITDLDKSAKFLGAVNTVEFLPTGLRGHNTDGRGFVLAIKESFSCSLRGLNVFVLGSGGAGRAVAITAATEGASHISISDIDFARAKKVAAEIKQLGLNTPVAAVKPDPASVAEPCMEADLVVNATTVGMKKGDKSPLPAEAFRKGQMAFDLIYMYPKTPFMQAAAKGGARTSNGLGMLLHQGAYALSIWTGKKAPVETMRKALENAVYGKRNGDE